MGFCIAGAQVIVPQFCVAAELSEIQDRGYLIVAVKDSVRPLAYRDEAGELVGLEIDLARQLAAVLLGDANAVQLLPVSNQERFPALLNDEVDLVIARTTVTVPRARIVDFSLPYYLDGTALVTLDPTAQRLADLATANIAVLYGSTTIDALRSLLPNARLVGAESYQEALAAVAAGEVTAFAADASVLTGWVQENPQYRLLPTLLSGEALAIAMPRGLQYDELRQRVNGAIEQWYADGWLQERINYWGLP
ncbi:MAG: transporter substrate-binding domain-containing protein [Synechococcales bacterium]|nr:transporter substrate-binding domain-containing protein [Synechococcales bacterium]